MRKKGFTLIELLAVIVILAVIGIIVTPVVLNIIESADENAFRRTVESVMNAGSYYYNQKEIAEDIVEGEYSFEFPNQNDSLQIDNADSITGSMTINSEEKIKLAISNGKYCALKYFFEDDITVLKNSDDCYLSYKETILDGTDPELKNGMIPIIASGSEVFKANIEEEWYSYNENEWANVVIVKESISESKIVEENRGVNIENRVSLLNYWKIDRYNDTFKFVFTTGSKGGELSFDYSFDQYWDEDKLEIAIGSPDVVSPEEISKESRVSETISKSGDYTYKKTLEPNTAYIVEMNLALYYSSSYAKTLISNIELPKGSSELTFVIEPEIENEFVYDLVTYDSYEFDPYTGMYYLSSPQNISSEAAVGNYLCDYVDLTSCKTMYKITGTSSENTTPSEPNVELINLITSVNVYSSTITSEPRKTYLDAEPGTKINEDDILGYFVWIPRYRYLKSDPTSDIIFENATTKKSNGTYLTHPAFTFGKKELNGMWVGKYETGHVDYTRRYVCYWDDDWGEYCEYVYTSANLSCVNESCSDSNGLRVTDRLPLTNKTLSNYYFAARSMQQEGNIFGIDSKTSDVHMMKNTEWGAVAYLLKSKYASTEESKIKATHVKNMYGSPAEYVMGFRYDEEGYYGSSGFTSDNFPDKKYVDLYSALSTNDNTYDSLPGDGISNSSGTLPDYKNPWFVRGACKSVNVGGSYWYPIYETVCQYGGSTGESGYGFRIVIN